MVKKVLIVVGLLVFSVITYIFSGVVFLYNESVAFANELNEERNFVDLNRLAFGTILDEDYTYEHEYEDGTMLYTFKEISPFYEYDEDGNITNITFNEGLQLFFANIDEDFGLSDVGEVKVIYETNYSTYEYSGKVEHAGYFYEMFGIYSISIETADYSTLYNNTQFNKVELYSSVEEDEDGKVIKEAELIKTIDLSTLTTSNKCFSSEESNLWDDYIITLNEYYEEKSKGDAADSAVLEALEVELDELLIENFDKSSLSYSTLGDQLQKRTSYVVKTTITLVAIILLNIIVIYMQFIRGKNLFKKASDGESSSNKKDVIEQK